MPEPPLFGDVDFQQALLRVAPKGVIWRRDNAANFAATMLALAPTYTRSTAAAAELLVDANPTTTVNLLEEWEESLGLPDPCTASNPSVAQRQAAVRAKWAARGGLTTAYFVALAAALGFTITITEFQPFSAGMPCGQACLGPAWLFAWQVSAPQVTTTRFACGSSAAGDPLTSDDSGELVCRITRDAPAGTTVFFTFSS